MNDDRPLDASPAVPHFLRVVRALGKVRTVALPVAAATAAVAGLACSSSSSGGTTGATGGAGGHHVVGVTVMTTSSTGAGTGGMMTAGTGVTVMPDAGTD